MNPFRVGVLTLCVFLEFCNGVVLASPPNVTALFPSGGQVGQTVEITAQVALGDKPQAWVSRDGVKVEFAETGNKFKVTVAENVAPGVCWIRVFNAEGASSLRPFVIGTLPEVVEKEPNNSAKEAQKLESSEVIVNGVLDKNGEVDTFAVSLKAGQTLVASLTGKQMLGSAMDGVLQILSPRGFVLEHNDDDHGLDPQIAFTAPADGDYGVRVFAFPDVPNTNVNFHGAANAIYRLTLTTGPFVDFALPMSVTRGPSTKLKLVGWNLPPELQELPVEPGDAAVLELSHPKLANTLRIAVEPQPSLVESVSAEPAAAPRELALPSSITGVIGQPGEIDFMAIKLTAKQPIFLRMDARTAGSQLDPVLRIMKLDGAVLQEVDDGSKGDFDPDANFTAPADGEYRLAISDRFNAGGPRFFYRLSALIPQPDFELRVAADVFVIKDDKPLEIPVTIDRQRGFAQEIEVSISGLPEKVSAEAVVSAKEGDSAKSVKLLVKTEPGVISSGPIRIVGRVKSEPPVERHAATNLAALGTTTEHLWLTVAVPAAK